MSILRFFSKPKKIKPYGWDIHSHILTGIDDVPDTINEYIERIKSLIEIGFTKFICTPHTMSDFFKNTSGTISKTLGTLKSAVKVEKLNIQLKFAAEYYLDKGFIEKLENKDLLTFSNNYLLFETSYINKPNNLKEVIFKIITNGYKTVLAHPERYTYMFNDFNKYKELYNTGVLFQINVNSLTGYYSKVVEQIIDNNMTDFFGSDCHKPKHVEIMQKAMASKYYSKALSMNLLNYSL